MIDECIKMIQPLADEHAIQIDNQLVQQKPVTIRADMIRGRQVIMNLLSNAVKYNKRQGKIIIFAQTLPSGELRISIQDTGSGIAAENFPLIFDYFQRLESEMGDIQGTGIGLAVAKQLMEMMHGRIGVESRLGAGSTFWVDWPVAEAV